VDADSLPFEENTDEYNDSWMNLSCDGSGVSAVDPDLDCNVEVRWDRNKDWSETEHEWGDTNWGDVAKQFSEMLQGYTHTFQRKIVRREDLNEQQQDAHDWFVKACSQDVGASSTDGGRGFARLVMLLGLGGTGKSFTVDSIITTLHHQHGYSPEQIPCFATTGKAATIIGGSTLHSWKQGFGLPVNKMAFRALKGDTLKRFQERFKDVKGIIIDEFSML